MTAKAIADLIDSTLADESRSQSTWELMLQIQSQGKPSATFRDQRFGVGKRYVFAEIKDEKMLEAYLHQMRAILEVQRRLCRAQKKNPSIPSGSPFLSHEGLVQLSALDHEITFEETTDFIPDPVQRDFVKELLINRRIKP